ncbi:MAG TPA: GGDEF domain-containing protein [Gemmatimonadales bacterium]|nr:GGDEF domain-containing protein [Gemmatimonadales bacterium]
MIGERKAGAFVASEIGRSGGERRGRADRRQARNAVAIDQRAAAERRTRPDRRHEPAAAPEPASQLDAIAEHRRALSAQVGRDVGQEVAALDYLLNVTPGDQRPTVIDSAELADIERRAVTDALTGLFNRGFFDAELRRELARCRRHGVMASLVLIDVDDFKAANDRWGHSAGDAALRGVAKVIRRQLRAADAPCRYGGDEFAVVLPDTYRSGALLVGERIVSEVRRTFDRGVADCRLALTVSVGVAWYGAMCSTHGELLEAADRALYAAKGAGGDRVAEAS